MNFRKEILLVIGIIGTTILVGLLTFGTKIFDPEPMNFQIHDTYIVVGKTKYLLIIFTCILIAVNLVRGITSKFNNLSLNIILVTSFTIILIMLFIYITQLNNWAQGILVHIEAMNSEEIDERIQHEITSTANFMKGIVWTLVLLSGFVVTNSIFKINKQIKKAQPHNRVDGSAQH